MQLLNDFAHLATHAWVDALLLLFSLIGAMDPGITGSSRTFEMEQLAVAKIRGAGHHSSAGPWALILLDAVHNVAG